MSVESAPGLSENYFAAGMLVYNIGLVNIGKEGGFIGPLNDEVIARLKKMEVQDLEQAGVFFERDLFAPPAAMQGRIYAGDRDSIIRLNAGSLIASREIITRGRGFRTVSAEIVGQFTDLEVAKLTVKDYRNDRNGEYSIGPGEAANRIGSNVLSRTLKDFRERILN